MFNYSTLELFTLTELENGTVMADWQPKYTEVRSGYTFVYTVATGTEYTISVCPPDEGLYLTVWLLCMRWVLLFMSSVCAVEEECVDMVQLV